MPKELAVIIPVKNEEKTLQSLVSRISKSLSGAKITFEIVIVDDMSDDNSWKIAQKLKEKFPVTAVKKVGKPGKAFSILEGIKHTKAVNIAFIDADLQYPPEALVPMYHSLKTSGLVIGKRIYSGVALVRAVISKLSKLTIGRALFGTGIDIQSGMKVFRREIIDHLRIDKIKPWTLDLPLLLTAQELGYSVTEFDIEFAERRAGKSKISLLSTSLQIGLQALHYKFRGLDPLSLAPESKSKMLAAGFVYQKRRYVTHTTLDYRNSALHTFTDKQKFFIFLTFLLLLISAWIFTVEAAIVLVAILSIIYFIDVCFNFFLILRSLHFPPEIDISQEELAVINDDALPIYTILCPLYKEAHILPHFIEAIENLDWPKDKLDVLLLLESDDTETIEAAAKLNLPIYIRPLVVPHSEPKTKPKACNYGLGYAKGEYLVIYDAEDKPDSDQLKKVYLAFQKSAQNVKCIQAKLNYFNPHQNLLTRFFTAEYSLWFDVILTGLQSIETTIPLGGTSNHFRTQELQELEGWDPFNVTEDCDLGIRLFKRGARTAVINSVTYEEANSNWGNWLRQRSRWIKGYIQTYLVHTRHPIQFMRTHGKHAWLFHLSIGGKIAFLFINPLMWLLTISYFVLYSYVGPAIQALYPPIIFYLAVTSLIFGNFMFIYYYMIGVAKREHWGVMKYVLLVPFYWLMTSIAACIGLYQLIVKPHYWEKTVHGLHLKQKEITDKIEEKAIEVAPEVVAETINNQSASTVPVRFHTRLINLIKNKGVFSRGALLIVAAMAGNVLNFIFNAYLGRRLLVEDFGLLSLTGSFLMLAMIPLGALGVTTNYRTGYLHGKYGLDKAFHFWNWLRGKTALVGFLALLVWLMLTPLLMQFFHSSAYLPFISFSVIWLFGSIMAVDSGYLSGRLHFHIIALMSIVEAVTKLLLAFMLVELGFIHLVYISIPISIIASFIVGRLVVLREAKSIKKLIGAPRFFKFPKKFFLVSLLSGVSTMSFLSLDIIIVKHVLAPTEAGQYALISLVGKIIFFLGTLASQFVLPIVSHNEGAQKDSRKVLHYMLAATGLLSFIGCIFFGLLSSMTLPLLLGERVLGLTRYLPLFTFGMFCFALSRVFMNYYLAKKTYLFSFISFAFSVLMVIFLFFFHDSLLEVVEVMAFIGISNLAALCIMHFGYSKVLAVENNLKVALDLFTQRYFPEKKIADGKQRILFFNWRDTKHVWAGGAEVYIHEIAKELVKKGHQVTVFCGNDGHHPYNETIDGVHIVRRGGFYTVYIWAFIYYTLKFKGKFDVVIDSENGLPFFTPFYVEVPKFLLIHHIHQQVFREHLKFPFYYIAMFIESRIMPFLYKDSAVITVSESSRKAIGEVGLHNHRDSMVVNPGFSLQKEFIVKKTKHPTVIYMGRLKEYKNIHVALRAFAMLLKKIPTAHLTIAGEGDMKTELVLLAKKLGIAKSVEFVGRVSEAEKAEFLSRSWVAVQPSMIEGWGITVIEANAAGTPVVAANVSGLRDSVVDGKTGYLVEPLNVKQFYEVLLEIVTNSRLRKKLSVKASEWAQEFSWEASANKILINIEEYQDGYEKQRPSMKLSYSQQSSHSTK